MKKHQNIVNKIYDILKSKQYVKYINKNVEYSKGEMDIECIQGHRYIYY